MLPNQGFNEVDCLGLNDKLGMIRTKMVSDKTRVVRLVKVWIPSEAETEGLHGLVEELAHQAHDDAGVDTTAQERTKRYV